MSDGFVFETPLLDLEIYRLITMLGASPALVGFEGIVDPTSGNGKLYASYWSLQRYLGSS